MQDDKQPHPNLANRRDADIDTGYSGVVLSRRSELHQQQVTILVLQNLWVEHLNQYRSQYVPVGAFSQAFFSRDPQWAQTDFEAHLDEAIALRHYHNDLHANGTPPSETIYIDSVPVDYFQSHYPHPSLSLSAILTWCSNKAREKPAKTLHNDPVGQQRQLLQRDLGQPSRPSWFCGFNLNFKRYELGECTLYLPRMLYRARGEWRIRIQCANGPWITSIPDKPGQLSSLESLTAAWVALISALSVLRYDPAIRPYIGEPLLWTGVEHLTFNVLRNSDKSQKPKPIRIQLRYQYTSRSGKSRRVTLGYWALDTLTDESLWLSLRKGAALARYLEHLGAEAPEVVPQDFFIPSSYWPSQPVTLISGDDIRYYVERLQARLTLKTRQ